MADNVSISRRRFLKVINEWEKIASLLGPRNCNCEPCLFTQGYISALDHLRELLTTNEIDVICAPTQHHFVKEDYKQDYLEELKQDLAAIKKQRKLPPLRPLGNVSDG